MLTFLLGDVLRIFAGDFTAGEIAGQKVAEGMWLLPAVIMLTPIVMVVLFHRPRRLAAATAVAVTLLALVLAGCASSTPPANPSSAPLPPSAAVGYWRSPADYKPSRLVCIRLIQGRHFLWWPPLTARAPLVVEGNRLVRHHYYPNGQEMEREVFWARPGGTLAVVDYLRPNIKTSPSPTPWIANFTKATGTAAQLAAELRGRFAVPTIEKQVGLLMKAVGEWASRHGGFPPRAALLPGGAFWKWKGAPHLTNAVTGGPMVLGSGAGNFDYTSTGTFSGSYSYSISGHLPYGLGETTEGESGSP